MPKTLQLIIEPPGAVTPISVHVVDESVTIGAFVAQLSVQLGYPNTDGRGAPVAYQLRPAGSNTPLHGHQKFAGVGIPSGTHLVLERVASPRRWSRRAVLIALTTLSGFAVTGLGAGFAASVANASIRRRSLAAAPLTPAQPARSPAVVAVRGATVQGTFSAHQQTVRVVSWSPDGTKLASGSDDGLLLVWSVPGMVLSRVQHQASVQALAWSPEGQRIVTGAATEVRFFTALTGALLATSTHQHTALVTSLAWTPHQQMHVVSGSADMRAIIWESVTYQAQTVFTGHTTPIEGVCWAADGQTVASSSQGGSVRVWNAGDGQEVHPPYLDALLPMRAIAFAPTGTMLAVGGSDGIIRIWNGLACLASGTGNQGPVCIDPPLRLQLSQAAIRNLSWSPDGQYLASGNQDGTIAVWSPVQSQAPLFSLTVKPGQPVHSLAWSPIANMMQLATAAGNTVVLWNLQG